MCRGAACLKLQHILEQRFAEMVNHYERVNNYALGHVTCHVSGRERAVFEADFAGLVIYSSFHNQLLNSQHLCTKKNNIREIK